MRKAWRKKKREQAAAAANVQYMATTTTWNPRGSMSSGSEYERRESDASFVSGNTSDYSSHRGSVSYASGYTWGDSSRPTTSSSVASSDERFVPLGNAYATGMINPAPAVRRPSAPSHMPIAPNMQGFKVDDTLTPTAQNPYSHARPSSSHDQFSFQTLTSPMPMMAGPQAGQFAFQR
jgi:hypothetical protein